MTIANFPLFSSVHTYLSLETDVQKVVGDGMDERYYAEVHEIDVHGDKKNEMTMIGRRKCQLMVIGEEDDDEDDWKKEMMIGRRR